MAIEPAIPQPLRWSETLISFNIDDQWTSFSEPGKFPLVLDPVVPLSRLNQVLINEGSRLNLLFASILKQMWLDISNMLTPKKGSLLRNRPRELGYTPRAGDLASCLRDTGEL
jgi:hypothetical protein